MKIKRLPLYSNAAALLASVAVGQSADSNHYEKGPVKQIKRFAILMVAFMTMSPLGALNAAEVTNLRCEYREAPLGIEVAKPRLGWIIGERSQESEVRSQKGDERGQKAEVGGQRPEVGQEAIEHSGLSTDNRRPQTITRGIKQTAYQVLVASSEELLKKGTGDLWDSGKVESDQTAYIPYSGALLKSSQKVFWKVRVWTSDLRAPTSTPSEWSKVAEWTMGLLKAEDWNGAKWICAGKNPVPLGFMMEEAKDGHPQWVQVDMGDTTRKGYPIISIGLHPQYFYDVEAKEWIKGYGFPVRFRIDVSDDPDFKTSRTIVDQSKEDFPNPGLNLAAFELNDIVARYVRLTVLKMWQRKGGNGGIFALSEVDVLGGTRKNFGWKKPVMVSDSREADGWSKSHLTDGLGRCQAIKVFADEGSAEAPSEISAELQKSPHAAIMMRKEIAITKPVRRATVYMSGLGMSELSIDGRQVGDAVLSPEFTDYNKRVSYVAYDVTGQLKEGGHAIGVLLGNGFAGTPKLGYLSWFGNGGKPRLLLNLNIEYADGTHQAVVSDESWRWSTGEITFNDLWAGETVDFRLAQPGWNTPGFNGENWHPVRPTVGPKGKLFSRIVDPLRVLETVKPVSVSGNTATFKTLGAGWIQLKTTGQAGDKITVDSGQRTTFILKGGVDEVLEPKFIFHTVNRDVTVTGLRKPLTIDTIARRSAGIDMRRTGSFACSSDFLNRTYAALLQTQRNYNFDYPMDPTREKAGWTQDVMSMIDHYDFDTAMFYWNWWLSMRDNQRPDGYLGSVIPLIDRVQEDANCVWWSGMIIYTPWKLYQYYGDKRVLEESYPAMKAYLDWLACKADNDKVISWGLGDWIEAGAQGRPSRTSREITSTCGYYLHATILADTAKILGEKNDEERYRKLAAEIKDGFRRRLFNPDSGLVGRKADTQTGYILPLYHDMLPADKRQLVIDRLVANIHERNDHISSGFVGNIHMLLGMPELGYQELIHKMVMQQDSPGWNSLVKDGVFKEEWGGSKVQMPSLGGPIGAYMYQVLGGIRPDAPGFRKIRIKPAIVGDLTWVNCSYDSSHGRIVSNWKRDGEKLTMDITIPGNTTATVYVPVLTSPELGRRSKGEEPVNDAALIRESGKTIDKVEGVKFLRMENSAAVYEIGSGSYQFQSLLQ